MADEAQIHFFCQPHDLPRPSPPAQFVTVQQFLADEPACKELWNLLVSQFRTRSKFLAIWPSVRYVAMHRDANGAADGFLLVTTPVNWQIDYVVVKESSRGQGIAAALVKETVRQAFAMKAPYVMLTSKASLRPLYESCGFIAISGD
jgi:ribosomal protein S18 acetylase RimI-like enzyme